jgi:hypothetical protein
VDDQPRLLTDPLYAAVAARRLQWDALLWQVPALSITGQAFLMTIAFGADTSRTARIIVSAFSVVWAFATLHLYANNRWAELVDAHLLEDHERATGQLAVHGRSYKTLRDADPPPKKERYTRMLRRPRPHIVWKITLTGSGLMSLSALLLAIFCPSLLDS